MSSPLHPMARAAPMAPAANRAAPRAEFAFPPRSRVAAITGAPSGVDTVAASAFRPRTSRLLHTGRPPARCLRSNRTTR